MRAPGPPHPGHCLPNAETPLQSTPPQRRKLSSARWLPNKEPSPRARLPRETQTLICPLGRPPHPRHRGPRPQLLLKPKPRPQPGLTAQALLRRMGVRVGTQRDGVRSRGLLSSSTQGRTPLEWGPGVSPAHEAQGLPPPLAVPGLPPVRRGRGPVCTPEGGGRGAPGRGKSAPRHAPGAGTRQKRGRGRGRRGGVSPGGAAQEP